MINALESLCYHDLRNPDNVEEWQEPDDRIPPRQNCACDNCFYGRDKLALEIIRLQEIINTTNEVKQ